jgi:hypothetical protein
MTVVSVTRNRKAPARFFVGRVIDAFGKEIAHAIALADDRARDFGGHDRAVLAAQQSLIGD